MYDQDSDEFQDIRDAVRALCADFPDEYHRKIDEDRAYPEAFVDALTKAMFNWLQDPATLPPANEMAEGIKQKFSVSAMSDAVLDAYRQCLSAP